MEPSEPTTKLSVPETRQSKRRPAFYLAAVLLGLLPFVAIEILLRLFGIGSDAANAELHAGFGATIPLFELDADQQSYRTNQAKQQFFVADSFAASKPDKEFRVFCLGGSTVQGRPYRPETSFGQWLELELNATDQSRNFNVVNCGGISYASYRLRPVLKEVLNYQPDLIIVATGHNEFLEDRTYDSLKSRSGVRMMLEDSARSLRTVMLLRELTGGAPRVEPTNDAEPAEGEVETRLDNEAGYASYHRDEQWRSQVRDEFAESVADMAEMCKAANVPLVFVKLGANLRDCPPFKSEHREGLSVEDEQLWQALFDEAEANAAVDTAKALKLYERAAQIDDQYPLLHFRIARTLDQLGRFSEALQSYQIALNQDICPLRMTSPLVEQLRGVATKYSVPLIDAASAVSAASSDGITGFDAYIDHVHPTIGVHQIIASEIASSLREIQLVGSSAHLDVVARRRLFHDHLSKLESTYYSNGRRRIGWLEGWAQRKRLYDETLPVDARGFVATALRNLDLHRFDEAQKNIISALEEDVAAGTTLLKAAASVFQQGRSLESDWLLKQVQANAVTDEQIMGVQLGFLVLALEASETSTASQILATHDEQWAEIIANDTTGWSDAMPDLNARIATLKPAPAR